MNLARSSLKLFVTRVASAGIQFLGITYFAQELGAAPMGVFFLFKALLGMLAIPGDFGLRGAVEKRISEGEDRGTFLSSAIALKLVPIAVIVLASLLFRPIINEYLGAEIAVYLAAAIVLQEAAKLSIVVLKGELRVGETAILQAVRQVTWVGIGALFVSQGFGAVGLVYGLLAGLGVMSVWGWYKVSVFPSRPSRDHAYSLFDYGKYNFISSVGGYFYGWMDVAIIGLFLTQAHVGTYEIAWRVTAIVMLLSQSIAATVFPQVSRWDAEDTTERIESMLSEAITPALFVAIPAFFGTVLFSREILRFVFGPEYSAGWLVLIILMGEKLVQSVHIILGRSLQGIDRPDLAAKAGIIGMALNLVLNVILVIEYGIVGAAIATAISFVVNSFLHAHYLSKFVSIRISYTQIGGFMAASIGMSLILSAIESVVRISSLPSLILLVLSGMVIYGGLALLIPSSRRMVFDSVRKVVS